VNNDCVEVDALILEIADYTNDYSDMAPKNFLGSARPVGKLTNTFGTACMKAGYPTEHDSNYDKLSKGYRCDYFSVTNTAMLMTSCEGNFLHVRPFTYRGSLKALHGE
jgi:hypothetical protein